jgi:hypothetical protein
VDRLAGGPNRGNLMTTMTTKTTRKGKAGIPEEKEADSQSRIRTGQVAEAEVWALCATSYGKQRREDLLLK